MTAIVTLPDSQRYARSVEASRRVYWEVEADVIRGRRFDPAHKFLPDGLVLADAFTTRRCIDVMIGDVLPDGYRFDVDANAVAHAVLGKSTWAVMR